MINGVGLCTHIIKHLLERRFFFKSLNLLERHLNEKLFLCIDIRMKMKV